MHKITSLLVTVLAIKALKKQLFWISVLSLTALAVILRWYPIHGGLFTFEYDMAKDSLIMLEMFQYKDPSLVGPTTSIPGLFYGPAWYYIALIPSILGGFSPFIGVLVVWLAVGVNIYIFKKYLGTFEAFMYAVSSGLIGAQQNAWTPYMTTLLTGPLLVALTKVKAKKKIDTKHLAIILFLVSLYFHFQPAYGIVILPITIVILLLKKVKTGLRQIVTASSVFLATILPMIAFELKNNFNQTKSLLAFMQDYGTQAGVIEPNATGIGRLGEVVKEMTTIAGQSLSPVHPHFVYGLVIVLLTLWWLKRHKNRDESLPVAVALVGTYLMYLVLPVKAYYLVAIMPIWIFAMGRLLSGFTSTLIKPFIYVVFFVLAVLHASSQRGTYERLATQTADLYAPKAEAVQTIYDMAGEQEFRSYHFVPQVYDYTYQFIYLNEIRKGAYTPAEFSYAPGETSYNVYKHISPTSSDSDLVFLIVEKPQYQNVQDEWWSRVGSNLEILEEVKISEAITVYKTKEIK